MSRRVTKRVVRIPILDHAVGCNFETNHSPTICARMIGYDETGAYYVVCKNNEWTKYNDCEGQVFWLPLLMARCLEPVDWSCEL